LKKSFGGGERNFLELLMSFARSDVGIPRFSEKRPRTFVLALWGIPAAELSKNQHLRDFWRRSIFDFFSSIGQKRRLGDVRATSALAPKTDIRREGRHVSNVPILLQKSVEAGRGR
jgi:hypothetical protein